MCALCPSLPSLLLPTCAASLACLPAPLPLETAWPRLRSLDGLAGGGWPLRWLGWLYVRVSSALIGTGAKAGERGRASSISPLARSSIPHADRAVALFFQASQACPALDPGNRRGRLSSLSLPGLPCFRCPPLGNLASQKRYATVRSALPANQNSANRPAAAHLATGGRLLACLLCSSPGFWMAEAGREGPGAEASSIARSSFPPPSPSFLLEERGGRTRAG
ncbi:uncharacterized protein PSFLO_04649 [Pseudozyma flocculosa]|uniref:Secreted protein n=1 Tax=Pseudozyma flocculosa TaxID=84751 RepID=A0A5C3F4Y2_9BASI|nr:uncharacterized protein PSFLO_04649 [Pseudozyma flocculosa]